MTYEEKVRLIAEEMAKAKYLDNWDQFDWDTCEIMIERQMTSAVIAVRVQMEAVIDYIESISNTALTDVCDYFVKAGMINPSKVYEHNITTMPETGEYYRQLQKMASIKSNSSNKKQ